MSLEDIPFCHDCQITFRTVEDLSLHSCMDIKQETDYYGTLINYDIKNGIHLLLFSHDSKCESQKKLS